MVSRETKVGAIAVNKKRLNSKTQTCPIMVFHPCSDSPSWSFLNILISADSFPNPGSDDHFKYSNDCFRSSTHTYSVNTYFLLFLSPTGVILLSLTIFSKSFFTLDELNPNNLHASLFEILLFSRT